MLLALLLAQAMLTERGLAGPSPHFRPVRETVRISVDHRYARTLLQQEFENVTAERLEGIYRLQTPGAAVEGFAYWNGEQKIVGEVFEKQAARSLYDDVTGRGRDPGLLEQTGEGAFTFRVFPVEPHEHKRVEITLGQRLPRRGPVFEYRLTLAGGESEVEAVIEDEHPIAQVDSSSHRLVIERRGPRSVRVRAFAQDAGRRDLVLRVELSAPDWQPEIVVHRDAGHDPYLVLQLPAPAQLDAAAISRKDVTVVIDRSGSMTGEPLEQACAAAELVVRRLRADDKVNVLAFDHGVDGLFSEPQPVESAREPALQFIRRIRAGGGTDIALALSRTLKAQSPDGVPHIVLFLTDGMSDAQSSLRVAHDDRGDARVFTLGLGSGVNKPLLSRLAAMKRGRFTFIESPEVIEARVGQLFEQIESPALVGLRLEARGATLVDTYPRALPDVSAGDDLLVASRVLGAPGSTLTLVVHGTLAGKPWQFQRAVVLPERAAHPWAGRLWAKSRIDDLEEEIALSGDQPELHREVVTLGVAYQLASRYTSFLAVPERELNDAQSAQLAALRAGNRQVLLANADAAALSRTTMPPGDPVLSVRAPSDAVRVTAYFPFGLVRELHYDERLEKWTTRFLVPREVADGEYTARVVIVHRDGQVEVAQATYVIDSSEPEFTVERSLAGTHLRVVAAEKARRVTVALVRDPRRRVELDGDGFVFEGDLPFDGPVRVVVADEARNEAVRELR